jgi:hypothetical protein
MAHQKLTAKFVKTRRKLGHYGDGGGLYLQVTKWGTKSWVFRYQLRGRTHDMGLGSLELVSLAEAREAALACRKLLLEGRDPIEARNAERTQARLEAAKAISFQVCADKYIASHSAEWKSPKHRYHWTATLANYAYPHIGTLPVAAVDTPAVMRVLQPIWRSKPRHVCGAGSNGCWITQKCAGIATAKIRRAGVGTSLRHCQEPAR